MDIAVICLSVGFLGLLGFLGFYIYDTRNYIGEIHKQLVNIPTDLQKLHTQLSATNNERTHDSFKEFLKHIEKLERMTLPKPVTTKDVQDILNRTGEITEAGKFENDIEKETDKGAQLPNEDWPNVITGDTKVAFEGDDLPTVIEDSPVTVK